MARQFILATEGFLAIRTLIQARVDVLILNVTPETTFTRESAAIIATLPTTSQIADVRDAE